MSPSGYGVCFGSRISMVRVHSSRLMRKDSLNAGLFSIIQDMLKNRKALIIILILISFPVCAFSDSLFSSYDFTFYKTVYESLNIMDSSRFGFDYTGFGFVGSENTNGLFIRMGIQMPYTTLFNLFTSEDKPVSSPEDSSEQDKEGIEVTTGSDLALTNEYLITFTFGPAIRHVFSPDFSFYAGAGARVAEYITTNVNMATEIKSTTYDTSLSLDVEVGFTFNIEQNISCRIGFYSTFEILSYSYTTSFDDGKKEFSTSDIHLNAIATGQTRKNLSGTGYVSVAKTFSSEFSQYVYTYSITSREIGKGELSVAEVR